MTQRGTEESDQQEDRNVFAADSSIIDLRTFSIANSIVLNINNSRKVVGYELCDMLVTRLFQGQLKSIFLSKVKNGAFELG
jgi:hypothetical protein